MSGEFKGVIYFANTRMRQNIKRWRIKGIPPCHHGKLFKIDVSEDRIILTREHVLQTRKKGCCVVWSTNEGAHGYLEYPFYDGDILPTFGIYIFEEKNDIINAKLLKKIDFKLGERVPKLKTLLASL